jgi:hypothetical protein
MYEAKVILFINVIFLFIMYEARLYFLYSKINELEERIKHKSV